MRQHPLNGHGQLTTKQKAARKVRNKIKNTSRRKNRAK